MIEAPREIGADQTCFADASPLAALGRHNIVFSEVRQAVYELDDLSAFVWRCLDSELDTTQIVDELVEFGVARSKAREAVTAVLVELRELRRVAAPSHPAAAHAKIERLARLSLWIAGVGVQLHVSKALLSDVRAAFGHLMKDTDETHVQLCVRAAGSSVRFLPPGRPEWSCERSHVVPVLRAELIDSILRCAQYEVALHAAAVAFGTGALLLVGSPGAGKTTLAIALASAGSEVISDDVVLIDQDGSATGLPFPLTAKAPAWPLISHVWPGLTFEPSYGRPDGQTVAYLAQIPLDFSPLRRVESIILLNRQEHAGVSMQELDPTDVLTVLVQEGATRDERLSATGFKSLLKILREARCCRLTYSNLSDAVAAVRSRHS